jgi:hypothetical protein
LNLPYRRSCRLGLEDRVPNQSTFSVNRHGRFRASGILRAVFEEVVCGCMKAELIGGAGIAVDASVIEADASRYQRIDSWGGQQRLHILILCNLTGLLDQPISKPILKQSCCTKTHTRPQSNEIIIIKTISYRWCVQAHNLGRDHTAVAVAASQSKVYLM